MSTSHGIRMTWRVKRMLLNNVGYGVLSTSQHACLEIAAGDVWVPEHLSRCHAILKRLTDIGYLRRIEQVGRFSAGRQEYVYLIARKGAPVVAEMLNEPSVPVPRAPRPLALSHMLAINDVRIAFERAVRARNWHPPVWISEQTLRSFMQDEIVSVTDTDNHSKSFSFVPDGYFMLDTDKGSGFGFVEADLGTEQLTETIHTLSTWRHKIKAYIAYISSGAYTRRFMSKQLRVLIVTTTPKRLTNLKKSTESVGGRSLFWFSTFAHLQTPTAAIDAPIWQVAGVKGTYRYCDPDPSPVYYRVEK